MHTTNASVAALLCESSPLFHDTAMSLLALVASRANASVAVVPGGSLPLWIVRNETREGM